MAFNPTHRAAAAVLAVCALALSTAPSSVVAGRFCSPSDSTLCVQAQDAGNGVARITLTWSQTNVGWVAFGISPQAQMPGTDVFLAWPSGSNIVISDRYASARLSPSVDASQDITLGTGSSATAGNFTVVFLRKYNTGDSSDSQLRTGTQTYALAYRIGTPPSSAAGVIQSHDNADIISANLIDFTPSTESGTATTSASSTTGTPVASASSSPAPPSSNSGSNSAQVDAQQLDPYNAYLKAHGSLMFVAYGVLAPFAVALAFYSRGKPYFHLHWYIMSLSVTCALAGFAMSVYWTHMTLGQEFHFKSAKEHTITGVIIVGVSGGYVIHAMGYSGPRPARNWAHMWLGRGLFVLAICNIATGLNSYLNIYILPRTLLWVYVGCIIAYLFALFGGGWVVLGNHRTEWHEKRFGTSAETVLVRENGHPK
ncbi:hypothetical protein HDU93_010018 [Gonapodya sp. JEL0774]|nr:hypothetical protein HDU93_010018 [Gonapodya sp. JEL0774]